MAVPSFEDIFSTFHPRILRYLSNLSGEEDAEDLTQVVFLKVNQGLVNFRGDSSVATWIYRIATNVAIDHSRSSSLTVSCMAEPPEMEDAADVNIWTGEKAIGADQALERMEMGSCIRSVVDQLPEIYRIVLILSEFEGMSNTQIAEILHISLDTVKIRLHRARKKLKGDLQCQCSFYRDERNELVCDRKDNI